MASYSDYAAQWLSARSGHIDFPVPKERMTEESIKKKHGTIATDRSYERDAQRGII